MQGVILGRLVKILVVVSIVDRGAWGCFFYNTEVLFLFVHVDGSGPGRVGPTVMLDLKAL